MHTRPPRRRRPSEGQRQPADLVRIPCFVAQLHLRLALCVESDLVERKIELQRRILLGWVELVRLQVLAPCQDRPVERIGDRRVDGSHDADLRSHVEQFLDGHRSQLAIDHERVRHETSLSIDTGHNKNIARRLLQFHV